MYMPFVKPCWIPFFVSFLPTHLQHDDTQRDLKYSTRYSYLVSLHLKSILSTTSLSRTETQTMCIALVQVFKCSCSVLIILYFGLHPLSSPFQSLSNTSPLELSHLLPCTMHTLHSHCMKQNANTIKNWQRTSDAK